MRLKSIVAAAGLLSVSLSGYAADFLTGEQIKEAFVGKTTHFKHLKKGFTGKTYMAPVGSLAGEINGKKRSGTWEVRGNKHCISWGMCMRIEPDGNGGYYKVKGRKASKKSRLVQITKTEDGNTL